MGTLLLGILEQLLKLANLTMEERHRYEDDILKFKRKWHDEFGRPDFSDDLLDEYELQLRLLGEAILTASGSPNAPNK